MKRHYDGVMKLRLVKRVIARKTEHFNTQKLKRRVSD
jgi:hypothetical protein